MSPDRHGDGVGSGLGSELLGHVRRELYALDAARRGRQGQRHAARADGELERGAAAGQLGQQVHRRVEDLGPNIAADDSS